MYRKPAIPLPSAFVLTIFVNLLTGIVVGSALGAVLYPLRRRAA